MPLPSINHERKKSIEQMETNLNFSEAGNQVLYKLIEQGVSSIKHEQVTRNH
jgi:hypothetical protein